jgi:uncharacterized protein (TIGR00725 family)
MPRHPRSPTCTTWRCRTIRTKIGVVGSAGGDLAPEVLALCRELGREIARRGFIIVTGACPGLPQAAVLGAKELGGFALGISPALCLQEHQDRYHSPYEEYDALVFTGSGLMGREVDVVRTADVIVVVGGRSGTLGEFSIAYDDGNVIGVLLGTDGIAEHLEQIVSFIDKDTGTEMVYERDPAKLLDRALELLNRRIATGRAHTINEAWTWRGHPCG